MEILANKYIQTVNRGRKINNGLRGLAFACAMALGTVFASALPVDYYAASSKLAENGHWVKVKVSNTGMHRITADQLRGWGFTNPEKVHVFGYSAVELAEDRLSTSQPDDLPQVYSCFIDNNLYFYGEKDIRVNMLTDTSSTVDRNYYATYSIYFLSDADVPELSAAQIEYSARNEQKLTHSAFEYIEPEEYNALDAGTFFFSMPLARYPESGVFYFSPKDQTGVGILEYRNVAYSNGYDIKPLPALNSGLTFAQPESSIKNLVHIIRGLYDDDYKENRYCNLPDPTYLPVQLSLDNTPKVITFKDPGNCDYFGVDYVCLYYDRNNRVGDKGQLQIQLPGFDGAKNLQLTDCTPNTLVWDVTEPLKIKTYQISFNEDGSTANVAPEAGNVRLVAFDPGSASGFYAPEFAGKVNSATNLHAQRDPVDFVIISPSAMLAEANELAELHRQYQGLDVRVVDVQDVYNEFSSGTPSAIAYRRYAKFLSDLPDSKLANVLLFGHGTFDNRELMQTVENNLMTFQARDNRENPSQVFRSVVQCYGADSYFGMLNENMTAETMTGNKMDIGIGRIPVKDSSEAKKYVDKVKGYFEDYNKETYFTRSTLVSDYGNANNHMVLSEQAADLMSGAPYPPVMTKLYMSLYNRDGKIFHPLVSTNFAQGTFYWSYSGHASSSSLLSNSTINTKTVKEYPYGNHAIVMLATCSGLILDNQLTSIGRVMINEKGGPVAVVGACRSVYLHLNAYIYRAFTRYIMSNVPQLTLGNVYRNAFNEVIGSDNFLNLNTLCYNLGGDPALPIPYISRNAVVTAVDGQTVGSAKTRTSLTPITLAGEIRTEGGEVDTDFNGTLTIDLYNGEEVRASMEAGTDASRDESMDITMHEGLMATFRAPVKDGKWSITVTSPMPSRNNTPTLMVVAAVDATRQLRAMGHYDEITLNDPADNYVQQDTKGPRIAEMYLDSENFHDGDCVSQEPTLYVKVDPDESGISIMANPMGTAPSLVIDGKLSNANAAGLLRIEEDGSASMTLPLKDLADGAHTAVFTVFDNVGNFTRRSIGFSVSNSSLQGSLTVDNDFPIETTTIELGLPTTGTHATRLIVEDVEGNTMLSVENPTFPYVVNAKELPEGYYRAVVFLQSALGYGRTPFATFTVLKP